MANMLRKIITLGIASQFVGCSTYIDRPSVTDQLIEKPGTSEYIQFLTKPDRRVVLVNIKKDDRSFVCAEPSPDVAENLSASLQGALAAQNGNSDKINGSIAYAITKSADK
jgi:hypothetical protein